MRFHRLTSMINATNAYIILKWPLFLLSILITCLALTLFLSYQSHTWFTYQSFAITEKTFRSNQTETHVQLLEYGSFGLWEICLGHVYDQDTQCTTWTRRTRPEYFHVILVLVTCALVLTDLTIFPAWSATILIIYDISNRYTRYVVAILWILLVCSVIITALLLFAISLVGVTKYYSPGEFTNDSKIIIFHTGWGMVFFFFGKQPIDSSRKSHRNFLSVA